MNMKKEASWEVGGMAIKNLKRVGKAKYRVRVRRFHECEIGSERVSE